MEIKLYSKPVTPVIGLAKLAWNTTPLDANAGDQSEWLPCSMFSEIKGTILADVSGTLTVQFSQDGKTVDSATTRDIGADVGSSGFSFPVIGAFVRFAVANGSTNQSLYRFHAYGG